VLATSNAHNEDNDEHEYDGGANMSPATLPIRSDLLAVGSKYGIESAFLVP